MKSTDKSDQLLDKRNALKRLEKQYGYYQRRYKEYDEHVLLRLLKKVTR